VDRLTHEDAVSAERRVLARWRNAAIGPVKAAPADGRTETAPATHLRDTRAYLAALLGVPAEEHDASVRAEALVAAAA